MKNFILLLFSFLATNVILAQSGTVRGFVYDQEDQAAIPYANIKLKGTVIGKSTGVDGYFQLNNVPVGKYTLVVTFVGYKTIEREIVVKNERILTETFYLEQETQMIDEVVINVERQEQKTKPMIAVTSLSPRKIQQFSVGGDPDLVRAIQVLPGVITSGDQGGQLYIRGGAPIQNLVLLDGMIVYNPFHSIGFFSVFDTDILQSADVYSAGFNADYGTRTSSVMDIRTRDGNRERFTGRAYASTFMAKLLLESPIGKKKANGFAPGSVLVSAKTSYLDKTSSIFYPYVETEFADGLPFSFADIYGKLAFQGLGGSRIGAYGFYFTDNVNVDADSYIKWNSSGAGIDFKVIPPSSNTIIQGAFAASRYFIESTELDDQPRNSTINGFNLGLDFTYFVRSNDEIKYGFQAIGYATDYLFTNSIGLQNNIQQNNSDFGAYAKYRFVSTRFLVEPGMRVQYYGALGEISLEPRLSLKVNITEYWRFKASAGLYSQNLVAANSDRDVVNLFYGFLSGPDNVTTEFRGETVTSKLQKAKHVVAGFEFEVGKHFDINLEGYIKDFDPITNVNRNKIYPDIPVYADKPEILRKDFIIEKGFAYGIDLLLKYTLKNMSVWATYSYAEVKRDDGIQEYNPFFDRRHNTNIVVTYTWGENKNWEASGRYNFGSGFPFTQTQGYYPEINFVDPTTGRPIVDFDYTTANGDGGILYGALNGGRLPNYIRFDVSIRRTIELSRTSKLEIAAGATNIANRENIFYFNRVDARRVNQLPIMPTVSFAYQW
jgi:hypothetical protein